MAAVRASARLTDDWQHFDFAVDDSGVATVTFQRPERLNALTFEVYADLRDLLAELPHREDVKVLVVTGTGRGFCSGGDVEAIIGALGGADTRDLLDFTHMTCAVIQGMRACPQPIIAAVNGVAAGAGAVIALAADIRLVARSGSFAFLFTRVGLSGGDMGAAYLLPRVVGLGRASELLLLGERVDAETAVQIGLARAVVADGELASAAQELALRLAGGPTLAYGCTKALLAREQDMAFGAALEMESVTQAMLMKTEDFAEVYRAYADGRRAPRWVGR